MDYFLTQIAILAVQMDKTTDKFEIALIKSLMERLYQDHINEIIHKAK